MSLEQRTANDLISRIRFDLQDKIEPHFWSDDEIIGYIDEAQIEFCNPDRGVPIIDSKTPEVCEIPYKAGDTDMPTHLSIFSILHAFRDDDDGSGRLTELKIMTEADYMGSYPQRPQDYGNNELADHSFTTSARVYAILLDYSEDTIRLTSPADQAGILRLRVSRGPLKNIEDGEDKYEISRRYESALRAWANHLAYMKQDMETFDTKSAGIWEDRFNSIAGRANIEFIRRYTTPGRVQCSFP